MKQSWKADDYAQHAGFVQDLADDVLSWLAPQPEEAILDLGCGSGILTARLAETGAQVVGVDLSDELLEDARGRNLDVRCMDGQQLTFDAEFDAVFSNAALHWMPDADAVISGVHRALRPGGRFVAEFGGHGNVAAVITAMRAVAQHRGGDDDQAGPWFFPTPAEYRDRLEAHGFTIGRIGLFPRPTPLASGMAAWLRTFRAPFFAQFGESADEAVDDVVALLKPTLCDSSGNWTADYIRLRVEAQRATD